MQKAEITKYVMDQLGLATDERSVAKINAIWWKNSRKKASGGFGLTTRGYTCLTDAGIKDYKIKFEQPIYLTNQLTIWLDHFIDCPFYLTPTEIYVFSESMAVQLVLFSGDIQQFSKVKADRLKIN